MKSQQNLELWVKQSKMRHQFSMLESRLEVVLAEYRLAKAKLGPLGEHLALIEDLITQMERLVGISSAGNHKAPHAAQSVSSQHSASTTHVPYPSYQTAPEAAQLTQTSNVNDSSGKPANWNEMGATERMAWFANKEAEVNEQAPSAAPNNVVGFERPSWGEIGNQPNEPHVSVKEHEESPINFISDGY